MKQVICILACVLATAAVHASTTCSTTCPPPCSNKTCTVTCTGSSCIAACWDCQCYGDCIGGSPGGPGEIQMLGKPLSIYASNMPFGGLMEMVSAVTGLAVTVNPEVEVTLDGTWSGDKAMDVLLDIFDDNDLQLTQSAGGWTIGTNY